MILASVIGNLGRDAEVKHIGDKDYISFSVASTEKQGENETTTWVSVLASNNPNLLQYLKKGQQVFVSGKMKAGIYQSQQSVGIDISIFAQTLQLCGVKKEESQTQPQVQQQPQPQQTVIYPDREPVFPFPPIQQEDSEGLPF